MTVGYLGVMLVNDTRMTVYLEHTSINPDSSWGVCGLATSNAWIIGSNS